ncbi:MAG: metallophosphoesterase [bacterium]|nr:metallophosphoesterase [bacterium]
MANRWSFLRSLWSRRPPPASAGDLGLLALFALLGVVALVSLGSPARYQTDAFELGLGLRLFDRGRTTILIPPVGSIQAETHMTPLEFQVSLNQVDLDGLATFLAGDDPAARVEAVVAAIVRRFVGRVLVLAALGGVLGAAFSGRRLPADLARAAAVGLLVIGLLLGVSHLTYDREAFASARYTGVIGGAPWMVGVFEESLVRIRELGERLQFLAENLRQMFLRLDDLEALGRVRGDVRVLLVADIHNNPAAVDFMAQVARSFGVHFVVDAGDVTDFGSPLEALLVDGIAELGVPYLLAPGNHEAPPVLESLRDLGIIVLDGRPVRVAGLTVLGFACPGARTSDPSIPPDGIESLAATIEQTLDGLVEPPFLLVSHVPATVNRFAGRVPVIVSGHLHVLNVREAGGSVLVNPGTAGAAGVRGIAARGDIPMSLVLLYVEFTPEGPVAVAADTIRVYKVRAGFTLQRVLLNVGR